PPPLAPQHYGSPPVQGYVPGPPPLQTEPLPPHAAQARPTNWYYRMRMNRPQMTVMIAATLIFVTGGMNIGWSIGFRNRIYYHLTTHTKVAWFIGAIIGAPIGGFLPKAVPKRVITLLCATLVLIGGILNVTASRYDHDALTAGLYLNGIANGLLFAPTLALAGELAAFYMRGKLTTSTEQLSINFGIFLQILICDTWRPNDHHNDSFQPETVHGIIHCVFGFVGLCCAALMFIESPVDLLVAGRETAALEAVRRLQCDFPPLSDEPQLQEHKLYVAENKALPREHSCVEASSVFMKLCALRALSAISISCFVFDVLYQTRGDYIIFGACRLLGSFVATIFIEALGRKSLTLAGLLIGSGFAYATASQYFYPYLNVFMLLCFFQFFCGVAFTPTSAYLSEGYPLMRKQHFIGFAFMIEMLVFIILAICDPSAEFIYVIGGLFTGAFVLGIWGLPETRRTTLRESQKLFKATAF
ncbi:hypothetical protein KR222_001631, partial [Zaprionus bogoriensis]